MTPTEFCQIADQLGLSNADVAILTGNTIRAVQYWRTGRNPIPQSAYLLLKAMADGELDMDWVTDQVAAILESA